MQHNHLKQELKGLGIETWPEEFTLDQWYYFTNLEGWGSILYDMAFKSSLYRKNIFDCEDYALKAQVECAERYSINGLRLCIGTLPEGGHGFNLLFFMENEIMMEVGVMLWEPNAGFGHGGELIEIENDYGYIPKVVLL